MGLENDSKDKGIQNERHESIIERQAREIEALKAKLMLLESRVEKTETKKEEKEQEDSFQDFGTYLKENKGKLTREHQFNLAFQLLFIVRDLHKREGANARLRIVCPGSFKINAQGKISLKDQGQEYSPNWDEKPIFYARSNYDAENIWKSHLYSILRMIGLPEKFHIEKIVNDISIDINFHRNQSDHVGTIFRYNEASAVVSYAKGMQLTLPVGDTIDDVIKDMMLLQNYWLEATFSSEAQKFINQIPSALSNMSEIYGQQFDLFMQEYMPRYMTGVNEKEVKHVLGPSHLEEESHIDQNLLEIVNHKVADLVNLLKGFMQTALEEVLEFTSDKVKKHYANMTLKQVKELPNTVESISKIKEVILQALIIFNHQVGWVSSDETTAYKESKRMFTALKNTINGASIGIKLSDEDWQNAQSGKLDELKQRHSEMNLMTYQQWDQTHPQEEKENSSYWGALNFFQKKDEERQLVKTDGTLDLE
ncbi:MAG: hypothetical protein EP298_01055 [Gammaproteobacteria bacterium]|nr:MAG: hypothetical protein EP298_01055 [Gammaproteobacteria bacterium]UTW41940.1 hypothetical protein KFE69_10565 [bacterium SCSIO 12844]